MPKLWKYRPWPMRRMEKAILIAGFIIIWGYPIIFMLYEENWILSVAYIFSVFLFFFILRQYYCKKCMNFSCPLNSVDNKIKEAFLKNNPMIRDHMKI
jgi:hypothetical protein